MTENLARKYGLINHSYFAKKNYIKDIPREIYYCSTTIATLCRRDFDAGTKI